MDSKEVLKLMKKFDGETSKNEYRWVDSPLHFISNADVNEINLDLPKKLEIVQVLDADFSEESEFVSLSSEEYNPYNTYCFCVLFEAKTNIGNFIYYVGINYGSDWEGNIVRMDIPQNETELKDFIGQFESIIFGSTADGYRNKLVKLIENTYLSKNLEENLKEGKKKNLKM